MTIYVDKDGNGVYTSDEAEECCEYYPGQCQNSGGGDSDNQCDDSHDICTGCFGELNDDGTCGASVTLCCDKCNEQCVSKVGRYYGNGNPINPECRDVNVIPGGHGKMKKYCGKTTDGGGDGGAGSPLCCSASQICCQANKRSWCCGEEEECGIVPSSCCTKDETACGDNEGHGWCCDKGRDCGTFLDQCTCGKDKKECSDDSENKWCCNKDSDCGTFENQCPGSQCPIGSTWCDECPGEDEGGSGVDIIINNS